VASALVNTTQQVGGALGTAFLNTVAASATTAYLATRVVTAPVVESANVHGYTTAFEVSALLVALAAIVVGLFVRTVGPSVAMTPITSPAPDGAQLAFNVD
jgi:hypothetical protein